jgi:hypothetical protein
MSSKVLTSGGIPICADDGLRLRSSDPALRAVGDPSSSDESSPHPSRVPLTPGAFVRQFFGKTHLLFALSHAGFSAAVTKFLESAVWSKNPGASPVWKRIVVQRVTRAVFGFIITAGGIHTYKFDKISNIRPFTSLSKVAEFWTHGMLGYALADLIEIVAATRHGAPHQWDLVAHHVAPFILFPPPLILKEGGGVIGFCLIAECMAMLSGLLFFVRALQGLRHRPRFASDGLVRLLEAGRMLTVVFVRLPIWIAVLHKIIKYFRGKFEEKPRLATVLCALAGVLFIVPMDLYWLSIMVKNVAGGQVAILGEVAKKN